MYNPDIIVTTVKYIGNTIFNLISGIKVICSSKYAFMVLEVYIFVAKTAIFISCLCLGAIMCAILWCCACICYYTYFKLTPYRVKERSHAHDIYLVFAFFRNDFLNFLFFFGLFFFVILYAINFYSNAVIIFSARGFVEENNVTWDMKYALFLNGTPNRFDLLESSGFLKSSGFKGPGNIDICSPDILNSAGTGGGSPIPPNPNASGSLNASYAQQNTTDSSTNMSLAAPVADATAAHMSNPVATLNEVINIPDTLNSQTVLPQVNNNSMNPFRDYYKRPLIGNNSRVNAFYGDVKRLDPHLLLPDVTTNRLSDPNLSVNGCKIMYNSFNNKSHLFMGNDPNGFLISRCKKGVFTNCIIEPFTCSQYKPKFFGWGMNIDDLIRSGVVIYKQDVLADGSLQRSVTFPSFFRDDEHLVSHYNKPIIKQDGYVTIKSVTVKNW